MYISSPCPYSPKSHGSDMEAGPSGCYPYSGGGRDDHSLVTLKFRKYQSFIRGYKKTRLNFELERDITFIILNSKQINLFL